MKILLLATSFNGLSQRCWIELDRLNHQVRVHIFSSDDDLRKEVLQFKPHLIIAPYLKKKIPQDIHKQNTCFVVHPGVVGDRGSCSLDWAILRHEKIWGVTVIEAREKMDAGPVWATETFSMRECSKSSLYRHEVANAAVKVLLEAIKKFEQGVSPDENALNIPCNQKGKWNRAIHQRDLSFKWSDSTADIIRKVRAADSNPGVLVQVNNENYFCFGVHQEDIIKGTAGKILATRNSAICVGTVDGAIWLTHLQADHESAIKLPATLALDQKKNLPSENTLSPFDQSASNTFREICYEEANRVGYIHFDFYNGAVSTKQCQSLRTTFREACRYNTKVIVLMGGKDLWCNGIDLNVIEASDDPARESWANINALNDLIEEIICCESHYIISALHGNAGAGGVPFALAADKVIARKGIVLNPHTRNMGLYGSEFWTYLLPRRIGTEKANQFTEQCLPWGTDIALEVKLIDQCIDKSFDEFMAEVKSTAEGIAHLPYFDKLLQAKIFKRKRDEAYKPLKKYRADELTHMWNNFFNDNFQYDLKRHLFVHKKNPDALKHAMEVKDLFSERRKIWRRRKSENVFYGD